jgi:hypothetical protein
VYDLVVSGITAAGSISLSVSKSSYTITPVSKAVGIYYLNPVIFSSLNADGSLNEQTTKLTLTFNKDITGLDESDITINPGTTGTAKGGLTRQGTGVYELSVTGIIASGSISVTVSKAGYSINPASLGAAVYYMIPIAFNGINANGSVSETTTKLTLTFDQDIPGLGISNIMLSAASTGAVKGTLTPKGSGVYEVTLNSISAAGVITVGVSKSGYAFTPSSKTVTVYYVQPVSFVSLTANGSSTAATNKLTFTLDQNISGLTASDISLNAGSTGTVKGSLGALGSGVYELGVSGVSSGGNITMTVTKTGYDISPPSRNVAVIAATDGTVDDSAINITFAILADENITLPNVTIHKNSANGDISRTVSLVPPAGTTYWDIQWSVDDTAITGANSGSFVLNAGTYPLGNHKLGVELTKDGVPYSKIVTFTVAQ